MRLAQNVHPDDDDLLKAALLIDSVQSELDGINKGPKAGLRSFRDVKELQSLCFKAGKKFAETLDVPINTKLHRTMRHVKDHILNFGCLRKGATDSNESIHKKTKLAYRAFNHHLAELVS